jgi:hypothetical protein
VLLCLSEIAVCSNFRTQGVENLATMSRCIVVFVRWRHGEVPRKEPTKSDGCAASVFCLDETSQSVPGDNLRIQNLCSAFVNIRQSASIIRSNWDLCRCRVKTCRLKQHLSMVRVGPKELRLPPEVAFFLPVS